MRDYPDRPIVGVGVVVWQANRVLMVKRARAPQQGQWALPGGMQELGETVFEAAIREVREETALVIEPYAVITTLDLIERDGERVKYHYTLVEIAAYYISGKIKAADDVSAAKWILPEQLVGMNAWDEVRRVVELSRPHCN